MVVSPNIIDPNLLRTIYIALWLASSAWGLALCIRNWKASTFRLQLARTTRASAEYLRGVDHRYDLQKSSLRYELAGVIVGILALFMPRDVDQPVTLVNLVAVALLIASNRVIGSMSAKIHRYEAQVLSENRGR